LRADDGPGKQINAILFCARSLFGSVQPRRGRFSLCVPEQNASGAMISNFSLFLSVWEFNLERISF